MGLAKVETKELLCLFGSEQAGGTSESRASLDLRLNGEAMPPSGISCWSLSCARSFSLSELTAVSLEPAFIPQLCSLSSQRADPSKDVTAQNDQVCQRLDVILKIKIILSFLTSFF